jgi:hypothetical protein
MEELALAFGAGIIIALIGIAASGAFTRKARKRLKYTEPTNLQEALKENPTYAQVFRDFQETDPQFAKHIAQQPGFYAWLTHPLDKKVKNPRYKQRVKKLEEKIEREYGHLKDIRASA